MYPVVGPLVIGSGDRLGKVRQCFSGVGVGLLEMQREGMSDVS